MVVISSSSRNLSAFICSRDIVVLDTPGLGIGLGIGALVIIVAVVGLCVFCKLR